MQPKKSVSEAFLWNASGNLPAGWQAAGRSGLREGEKSIVMFVIAALVIVSLLVWILQAGFTRDTREVLMVGGVVIIAGFALFAGITRLRSNLRKEPAEDEFSKKIMTRASSLSYYISIYLWLFLMYLSDKTSMECHTLIGAGIMGMALVFFFSWLGVRFSGFRNE